MVKHATSILAIAVIVIAVSYVSWWAYHVSHYSEWVSLISIGDAEARVLAVVGHPVYIQSAADHLWCNVPGISHEYMYGTSIVASWDVIGFDNNGKVVCKQELQSP